MMMYKMYIIIGKWKMRNNKILISIWAMLIAIAIILFALMLSININAGDTRFYESFQRKHDIDRATGLSQDTLNIVNKDIVKYLSEGNDQYLSPHFNDREISHMRDVFALFKLSRLAMDISIGFIILSIIFSVFIKKSGLLLSKSIGYIIPILGIILLLVLLASTNFNKYFTIFHEVFFDNDLWILNPQTDLMIQMMPLDFFIQMSLKIFLYFLAILVLVILSYRLNEYFVKKNNKECILCNTKVAE